MFAPSSYAEQSAHCVMCRAAAAIMAIMSSPSQIGQFSFHGENQRARQGEDRGRTEGELTCPTAAGWGGSVWSGGKREEMT